MDDIGSRIKHITLELKDYVETRLELIFLNFSDKITYMIGQSVQQIVGYTIFGIGIVFALIALAIYLGEILGEEWAGYIIVGISFILLGMIFIMVKPKFIVRSIQDQILSDLLESDKFDKEEFKQLPDKETQKKESVKND